MRITVVLLAILLSGCSRERRDAERVKAEPFKMPIPPAPPITAEEARAIRQIELDRQAAAYAVVEERQYQLGKSETVPELKQHIRECASKGYPALERRYYMTAGELRAVKEAFEPLGFVVERRTNYSTVIIRWSEGEAVMWPLDRYAKG